MIYLVSLRYHRRALTERRGEPGSELAYVDQVVEEDPKNYHAWSHRQWVLQVRDKSKHAVTYAALRMDSRGVTLPHALA